MNTTGMIRGYMSKNMQAQKFIEVVIRALSREFDTYVGLENINENEFKITMNNCGVVMSMNLIKELQSPYGVDRFLLQEFEKQGFKFDKNRSQYIQYCFGIYENVDELVSM
ncbi:hypothetical protein LGL08_00290 [Clostridium estertheticum]|uniref:hypothetical protein n=1 Tax=Clostridium estertheticum TaxID=238834 RepID=UPI001CF487A0|nr:hypothetical protein [Clostridium estertheticum]MCB2305652.1 hypothetical protein [Clostridium estertheticum]MCB2344533.1 hypothetical protein [Clostridium estertheticum]MCB2348007.1 hypothetical protein [Clostridium estertheticum]WAG45653.1 hypothetical protein LL127_19380 [Clostridium estertheticum]